MGRIDRNMKRLVVTDEELMEIERTRKSNIEEKMEDATQCDKGKPFVPLTRFLYDPIVVKKHRLCTEYTVNDMFCEGIMRDGDKVRAELIRSYNKKKAIRFFHNDKLVIRRTMNQSDIIEWLKINVLEDMKENI